MPCGILSRRSDTGQISWGKLSRLPRTVAESTLRILMDMDFAVRCPLVQCLRLVFGFCPSTHAFARCFLQTPPRGGSPCTLLALHLHQVGQKTFTSKLLSMPSTQRTPLAGATLLAAAIIGYEAGAQIGRALFTADLARLYRPTGLVAPLGAALAGSYALGL